MGCLEEFAVGCCCLLPLSILKSVLMVGPVMAYSFIVGFGTGVIHFIRITPQLVYTICATERWTWRTSLLILLLLPIPLVLYWPAIILGALIAGFGFGLVYPCIITFDKKPCSGLPRIWDDIMEITESWWKFGGEMERELKNKQTQALRPGDVPYDIAFTDLFIAIVMSCLGLAIVTPLWAVQGVLKYVPYLITFIARAMEEYWRNNNDMCARLCCPLVGLCGITFIPIGGILFLTFTILQGIVVGIFTGFIFYDHRSIFMAFRYMGHVLREFDARTNKVFITEGLRLQWQSYSLLDCCCTEAEDPDLHRQVRDIVLY
jgi:hypothetical protein